jgi:hypothetical protein
MHALEDALMTAGDEAHGAHDFEDHAEHARARTAQRQSNHIDGLGMGHDRRQPILQRDTQRERERESKKERE